MYKFLAVERKCTEDSVSGDLIKIDTNCRMCKKGAVAEFRSPNKYIIDVYPVYFFVSLHLITEKRL